MDMDQITAREAGASRLPTSTDGQRDKNSCGSVETLHMACRACEETGLKFVGLRHTSQKTVAVSRCEECGARTERRLSDRVNLVNGGRSR